MHEGNAELESRIFDKFVIPEPNTPGRQSHEKVTGKPCKNCGGTLRYGGSYNCVTCTGVRSMKRKATAEYKKQAKVYWMRKRYGLSPQDAKDMLKQQGGICAICGTDEPGNGNGWAIDHCHASGVIRGVLCHGCNIGLGGFKDSREGLQAAIAYLDRYALAERLQAEIEVGAT